MNLSNVSDEQLLNKIDFLVQNERETLTKILHHLKEIQRRRLYSQLKYSSLFDYATKHLGYSEDQAWRRIAAMKLLKEIPEIEEKINNGSLSLSHLGMAKFLFNREEKLGKEFSRQQKFELLTKLEKTSKREAEKIVNSGGKSEQGSREVDLRRPITDLEKQAVDLRLQVSEEFLEKIYKLKCLLAHNCPNIETSELLEKLCDLGIEKWSKVGVEQEEVKAEKKATLKKADKGVSKTAPARVTQRQSLAEIKRQVWKRDQGRCQNCRSEYAIQIDHIQPKYLGGEDSSENLRLLCRSCNQRFAIEALGIEQMERFLN